MAIIITENHKIDALVALYNHTYEEIKRYRDYEWKILFWSIALMLGIQGIYKSFSVHANYKITLQILISIFTLLIAVYSIYYLTFLHSRLKQNKDRRRLIEDFFKLNVKVEYNDIEFFPTRWDQNSDKIAIVVLGSIIIGIVALYVIISLFAV